MKDDEPEAAEAPLAYPEWALGRYKGKGKAKVMAKAGVGDQLTIVHKLVRYAREPTCYIYIYISVGCW